MRHTTNILLLLFSIIFTLYLRESLIYEALGRISDVSSKSHYYVIFLFIITFLYSLYINNNRRIKQVSPIKIFRCAILSIFLISCLWSIVNPLPSKLLYIRIILPLFTLQFTYHIIQRLNNMKFFFLIYWIILGILLITYFQYYGNILVLMGSDNAITNSSYYLLYLLPVFLCTDKKYPSLIALLLISIAVFVSGKRGGTLAIISAMLTYLIIDKALLRGNRQKILRLIFIIASILIITYVLLDIIIQREFFVIERMLSLASDGGAGRDFIWKTTIDMIKNSGIVGYFIGHGFNQVLVDSPVQVSAHNDFLEIFYDFGMPVFIIYIILHFKFIQRIVTMIKQGSRYAAPFACSYVIFFVTSMVAHVFIYPHYLTICAFVCGLILSLYKKEQSVLIKSEI